MTRKLERGSNHHMLGRLLCGAFGLAPALLMLMTWGNHEQTWLMKVYVPTIVVAELATVIAAFLQGMRIRRNSPTMCLAALLTLAWTMVFFSPDPRKALLMTELWTLHVLFGFAAAYLFRASDLIAGLLWGFVLCTALIGYLALTAPPDFAWVGEMPGLGNPRSFAIYAAVAIGLCLGLLGKGKLWPLPVLAAAFMLVFWSGSRGAVVASAGTLAASLLLFPTVRRFEVWGGFLVSAAVGAALARSASSPASLIGVNRMTESSDNGRIELWRDVIELISQRPWFGYGEGQTEILTGIIWCFHPHNIILQVLLAWGVVGLVLVVILAVWAARKTLERSSPETLPLVCSIIGLAFYSFIDGALYNIHTVAIFAACVGVTMALKKVDLASNEAPLSPKLPN
ncbi:O-antigen ligase family protein [Sphingomonas sp. LHG3406-1]|uniref:O-antigen ligase family protein n=1 Tax=Sphingomonas sp. LHG3406-1 TaxID=2804617 RepID=UPI00260C2D55|nr:O-antigen ligase family protein [Sphingomonas sp. LHG3406-1]